MSPSGLKEKQLAMNSELSGQQGDPRNTGVPLEIQGRILALQLFSFVTLAGGTRAQKVSSLSIS